MDYSLLVGIHDRSKAEEELAQTEMARSGGDQGIVRGETSDSEECDSGERWVRGIGDEDLLYHLTYAKLSQLELQYSARLAAVLYARPV